MKSNSTKRISRVKTAMVVASSVAVSANIASATSIGLNFVGTGYGALGATVTADAYGVAVGDWDEAPDSGTGGAFTLAGVINGSWTSANDWNQNVAATPGEGEVNYGFADDTGDALTITLSGLSAWLAAEGAPAYTVQVVQASDNATGFTNTDLFDVDGGTLLGTLVNPTVGVDGAIGGITGASGALTGDTLFIDPTIRVGSLRGTVAGLVITTVPEPTSLALLGLGGLALALRRRQK